MMESAEKRVDLRGFDSVLSDGSSALANELPHEEDVPLYKEDVPSYRQDVPAPTVKADGPSSYWKSANLSQVIEDVGVEEYGFEEALSTFSSLASVGSSPQETVDMPCAVPCFVAWLVRGSTKERYALPEGVLITVGRSDECVVHLEGNMSVSRTHMRVACISGKCMVEDMGSKNGTYVDGVKVDPFEPVVVPLESYIRLGNEYLRLEEGTCAQCLKNGLSLGCSRKE